MTTKVNIDFQPMGRRGEFIGGESLLEFSRKIGVGIANICGGKGKCHACKVRVHKGNVSEPTPSETECFSVQEMRKGWRLACQSYPSTDCSIHVPPESMTAPQRTQVEGLEIELHPDPHVRSYGVNLSKPELWDLRADADRLLDYLKNQYGVMCRKVDKAVLRTLSTDLRSLNWQCRVAVRGDEVIRVGRPPCRNIGLAVDLGTTKIAGYLMDLEKGKKLSSRGMMNPQISFGEDVITRISESLASPARADEIQNTVIEGLNRLIDDLCKEANIDPCEILEAEVAGNTAMHHLLLGLPVKQLVMAPYVPAASMALEWKARELGLNMAPGAYIHLLPNIAGFIGGDHVAMLLAAAAYGFQGLVLALDIGTNTEISLINGGRIASVSCASGPAFEGYHIKHGMRAARGAIERIIIDGESVQYQTIDEVPPAGICGSGVLDAIAQMYLAGIIDRSGKMIDHHPRLRNVEGDLEFIIANEEGKEDVFVGITQKDIRQIQLAKAAIRAGIQILLEESGRSEDEIESIIIAGAFGSYIDVESAMSVGMLPRLPRARFYQVGNAAGIGVQMALASSSLRRQAEDLASTIQYVELAGLPRFSQVFVQACRLGDYEEDEE
jgi:uncharacterized 2Fe-2S/4Fe-4S cluster protein (DUF4445 family)